MVKNCKKSKKYEFLKYKNIQSKDISDKPRNGVNGVPYLEKQFSVWRGSQRCTCTCKIWQLGYTHIEGVIINE